MTTRERKLALVLVVSLLGGGGILAAKVFYFDSAGTLDGQLLARTRQLKQATDEYEAEKALTKRILALSPRLEQFKKLSLPQAPDASAEAIKAHDTKLRGEYQKFLEDLLSESGFTLGAIKSIVPDSRNVPTSAPKKPLYTVFRFDFDGESDLPSLIKVFEKLYRTPLLHQIQTFDTVPIASKSTRDKTVLATKMTIEVLQMSDAEKRGKERPSLKPLFSGAAKDKEPFLLGKKRHYVTDIAAKNIFAPPPPKTAAPEVDSRPSTENPDDVYPFVKLTQIAFSDYYGVWTARIYNQSVRNNSALLTAGPLPSNCQFVRLKKELELRVEELNKAEETIDRRLAELKKVEEKLEENSLSIEASKELQKHLQRQRESAELELAKLETPVSDWAVKDKSKETLLEFRVVRIDPLKIIIQVKRALYMFCLDGSLETALAKKLTEPKARALGLLDHDKTLRNVVLKKLEFRKDRRNYEGLFVNPENDDEKILLSTGELPEELTAPDSWPIRDQFGFEAIHLTLVKMEKDRIVFQSNKKHYAIKAGGNMFDAMAKPLSEDEVKALKLEKP